MTSLRTAPSIVPLLGVLMVLMSALSAIQGSVEIQVPPDHDCEETSHPAQLELTLHADLGATVCVAAACHEIAANRLVAEVRETFSRNDSPARPDGLILDTLVYIAADESVPWGLLVSTISELEYATDRQVRVVAIERTAPPPAEICE
jgi:biopolymer transport protein ExbD